MHLHLRRLGFALLVCTMLLAVLVGVPSASAQNRNVTVDRRDAIFMIKDDGTMDVVETWQVHFQGGPFKSAFRTIPLDKADNITNWSLSENGTNYTQDNSEAPNTYDLSYDNGGRSIKWFFGTTYDTSRTFELRYTLSGALQVFPGGDQFYWTFIENDRNYIIKASRVELRFPIDLPAAQLRTATYLNNQPSTPPQQPDKRTLVYTSKGAFSPNDTWELRAQVPHGLIHAAEPTWQVAARWKPLLNLVSLAVAGVIFLGGILGLLLLWYKRGRSKPTGLRAEFVAQPPAGVRPGIAGVLMSGVVEPRHVVATLADLGQRGEIQMYPGATTINFERPSKQSTHLLPFEQRIVKYIFEKKRTATVPKQGGFANLFAAAKESLYNAAVEEGYFNADPKKARIRRLAIGLGSMVGVSLVGCCSYLFVMDYAPAAILIVVAAAVVALAYTFLGLMMVQRTAKGSETLGWLRAFKRYLSNINKYTQVAQAKDQFDRYLPYAIAFGLEKSWIDSFAAVDTPAPVWYTGTSANDTTLSQNTSTDTTYGSSTGSAWTSTTRESDTSGSANTSNGPTFDSAATGAFASLNTVSASFFSMLNDTSSAFTPAPSVASSSSSSSSDSSWSSSSSDSSWSSSSSDSSWSSSSSDSGGGGSSGFD